VVIQQKRGHSQPFSRPLHKARAPTHGYEPTREAAMTALEQLGEKISGFGSDEIDQVVIGEDEDGCEIGDLA